MNNKDLLKKLLPAFLPILVYIIADEIWGTKIGISVAIIFGIAELIFIWFKEKRIDKFIIFDTILLTILGGVSILLENDVFFKIKPALIEAIFCIILGISAFSPKNIMLLMSKRYMKDIEIDKAQEIQFRKNTKLFFVIFVVHTLLIVYAAYFMSKEAWAFISGGLIYIIFGLYFIIEFIRTKYKRMSYKNEEWLPLVDEEGKITGKAPRSECHKDKNLLHPVVHVHIFNDKKELYLQKRPANKLVQPNKWDTSVGGHVSADESLETSLQREIVEETGINNLECKLLTKYVWESEIERELVYIFIANYNNEINFTNEEIADGRFWKLNEIKQNLNKNIFTPNFEYEFKKALLELKLF